MSNIVEFSFGTQPIRTLHEGDNIWFAARDIAEALGIVWNGNTTLGSIREDWKMVLKFNTSYGDKDTIFISEPALYKFAFRSNKESAEQFTDWVASEVLPAIRKTGSYSVQPVAEEDALVAQAQMFLAYAKFQAEQRRLNERQQVKIQEIECNNRLIEKTAHKAQDTADAAVRIVESNLGHFTVIGYAVRCKKQLTTSQAAAHGKRLTAMCKGLGAEMGSVPNVSWGRMNTYPEPVLYEYFKGEGWDIPEPSDMIPVVRAL